LRAKIGIRRVLRQISLDQETTQEGIAEGLSLGGSGWVNSEREEGRIDDNRGCAYLQADNCCYTSTQTSTEDHGINSNLSSPFTNRKSTLRWRHTRNEVQRREGKEAPRLEKKCDGCGEDELPLENCGRCQVAP